MGSHVDTYSGNTETRDCYVDNCSATQKNTVHNSSDLQWLRKFDLNCPGADEDHIHHQEALLGFVDFMVDENSKVPNFAVIDSAKLIFPSADDLVGAKIYQILMLDWDESSTWNSLGNGVDFSDASMEAKFLKSQFINTGQNWVDVTDIIKSWRGNNMGAKGLMLRPLVGDDSINRTSSSETLSSVRWRLEVEWRDPLPGDTNYDGEINSDDIFRILAAGKFNHPELGPATWEEGDFNGDTLVNSTDLFLILGTGKYNQGPY